MSSFAVIPDAVVMRETAKALLCVIGDGEPWIPRSQLDRVYPTGYRGAIRSWWLKVSGNQDLVGATPPPESEPAPVVITADDLPNAAALKRNLALNACAKFLRKGRQCYVEGKISSREYEAKDRSGKRRVTEVVAQRVEFVGARPAAAATNGAASPRPEAPAAEDDDIPF
jgi:Single-strand binding protein family